jgi:hypothetical protein
VEKTQEQVFGADEGMVEASGLILGVGEDLESLVGQ